MRLGVIDIGYNAIRAAAYEDSIIGAPEIFNSKFKNDIFSLLVNEDLNIKHQTYLSLQHIMHVFSRLGVERIKCVATAVLREHKRADDFIAYVSKRFAIDIDVISGEEEAKLSALGLISGISDARGIAADLGGGSLELVEIAEKRIGRLRSLPLGTKVLADNRGSNHSHNNSCRAIAALIAKEYGTHQYPNLYLIGGALRFISRLFIEFVDYPIKNLHNLAVPVDDFTLYLDKVSSSADVISTIGRRRINNNAILVAKAMIQVFQPKQIVVSNFGLKEGVRFALMAESEKRRDMVLEKVQYLCRSNVSAQVVKDYYHILQQLLPGERFNMAAGAHEGAPQGDSLEEILHLALVLSSLESYYDSTLPPRAISELVLFSEIPFKHRTRVMLGLILSYMTNFKPDSSLVRISRVILSKRDHNISQIIGNFIRISREIDGPEFTSPSFTISNSNGYLEIESADILPRAIFEKVCERLKVIAFARRMD